MMKATFEIVAMVSAILTFIALMQDLVVITILRLSVVIINIQIFWIKIFVKMGVIMINMIGVRVHPQLV